MDLHRNETIADPNYDEQPNYIFLLRKGLVCNRDGYRPFSYHRSVKRVPV